jgi:hypothetical protein
VTEGRVQESVVKFMAPLVECTWVTQNMDCTSKTDSQHSWLSSSSMTLPQHPQSVGNLLTSTLVHTHHKPKAA